MGKPDHANQLIFLSFVGPNYSRSSTILNFPSKAFEKKFILIPNGIIKSSQKIVKLRNELRAAKAIVVMSPCQILTPIVKLVARKPIILDAGWPLTDGQLSRGINFLQLMRSIRIFLVDFFAFHSATLIIVESKAQLDRFQKLFAVPKSKLKVIFTGLNETLFLDESKKSDLIVNVESRLEELSHGITVLFRGKVNKESGFSDIIQTAISLQDEASFIFVLGKNDALRSFPANVIAISEISDNEMKQIYDISDVAIGQISIHPRLRYTIPHKAFEAGFFGIPYISADSEGIREFLDTSSALLIAPPFVPELVKAIKLLKSTSSHVSYREQIRKRYVDHASQRVLCEEFDALASQIISPRTSKFRKPFYS